MAVEKDGNIVVGIGCYKREEWEQFLALADDREKLEDTYDEWIRDFRKTVRNMRKAGINPRKVCFKLDELIDFCRKKGLKNNAEARSEFFAELTRQGRTEEINDY